MRELAVGIDVGTSGVRAIAVGPDGTEVAQAARRLPASTVEGPRVTQEPEAWWRATAEALAEVAAAAPGRIAALAVDGTSGTLLLADAEGAAARARADVQRRLGGQMSRPGSGRRRRPRAGRTAPPRPPRGWSRTPRRRGRPRSPCTRPTGSPGGCSAGSGCRTTTTRSRPAGTRYGASGRPGSRGLGVRHGLLPEVREPGSAAGDRRRRCRRLARPAAGLAAVCGRDDGRLRVVPRHRRRTSRARGDGARQHADARSCLSDRPVFDPGLRASTATACWACGWPAGRPIPAARTLARSLSRPRRWRALTSRGLDPGPADRARLLPAAGDGRALPGQRPRDGPRGRSPGRRTTPTFFQRPARGHREARRARATGGWPSWGRHPLRSVSGRWAVGRPTGAWARIRARVLGVPLEAARGAEAAYGTALLAARALGC